MQHALGAARTLWYQLIDLRNSAWVSLGSRTVRIVLGIILWGLLIFGAARIVNADPALQASPACEAASPREARALADRLYEKGDYRRAGQCYQVAGDLANANLAFLKAAGPEGEDTAKALKAQRDAAKSLFAGVGRAFRSSH